jgi:hypothetical protein
MGWKSMTARGFALATCVLAFEVISAPACSSDDGSSKPTVGSLEQVASQGSAVTAPACSALSSQPLQLEVLTNTCGANQMQDFFEVINNGSTPVTLSDITIKFWADDTSGQNLVANVYNGGCVTNVGGNPSCVHQVTVTPTATSFATCGPDARVWISP